MTLWTAEERRAWEPAEELSGSEWATKHRVLGANESAVPGPWDPDLSPYLNEVMDALSDDVHQVVIFKAAAQTGKTEAGRNWLGRVAHIDPADMLIVFPTEGAAKETIDERIIPMVRNTPVLRELQTGRAADIKRGQVKLSTCRIFIGWATSAQSLATRPIRYVFFDECDKYPRSSDPGKEGDPISLGILRTTTFKHKAKVFLCSTPTNRFGPIHQGFSASEDRRFYYVPCPHCGGYQELRWEQVRFTGYGSSKLEEHRAIAAEAELGMRDVHYLCALCSERIEERERAAMVAGGEWISEGYERGETPDSTTVAFTISSLYSPWVSWSKLVGEHFDARLKGAVDLHGWINGRLGRIVEDDHSKLDAAAFLQKATRGHAARIVPDWSVGLVATADTQKNGWYVVIRAWGRNFESRLIAWALCPTEEDLKGFAFQPFPVELGEYEARSVLLLIDAGGSVALDGPDGNTTERVYRIAAGDPERIKPIKGHGGRNRAPSRLRKRQGGKELPTGVVMYMLCTQTYKDLLSARIRQDDPEVWQLTLEADLDYCGQMASEQRITTTVSGKPQVNWTPISRGIANHLWDAETYQCAGADLLEVDTRKTFAEQRAERSAETREGKERSEQWDNPSGWWSGARTGRKW